MRVSIICKKLYLVTGFLGAGKTTFLNHCLTLFPGRRCGVIVNEYGKQGVDGGLLSENGIAVTEITNGSIFCVCRVDLFVDALRQALATVLDVLIVETSGLSNPATIDKVLEETERVTGERFDYRGCICLIDGKNFFRVRETAPVVLDQIASASLLLLNKSDLLEPEALAALTEEVAGLNPGAEICPTSYGRIPVEALERLTPASVPGTGKLDIRSTSISAVLTGCSNLAAWERVAAEIGGAVYRCKGYLEIGGRLYFVNGVTGDMKIELCQSENHPLGITLLYDSAKKCKNLLLKACEQGGIVVSFL